MKKDIHPKYYDDARIICACGNVVTVGSTVREMKVEVCSACHPFYTGKKKLVDTTGRVERFKRRTEKTAKIKAEAKKKKSTAKYAKKTAKKKTAKKK